MIVEIILAFMLSLMPSRGEKDEAFRRELAAAIESVTDDTLERLLLAKIPRFESSYRRDVGECRRKGPQGEVTAWQILPRSDEERKQLCVSLAGDARVALQRIRESLAACARFEASIRLAVYARGRCTSPEGQRLSRIRWVAWEEGVR